jgi:Zn-dependent protease with chaperone function
MMHFLMMIMGLGLAWGIRWQRADRWANQEPEISYPWTQRWQTALGRFLFPPLLLLMTAIAILFMGPSGKMVWHGEGWLTYGLANVFLMAAIGLGGKLAWEGWQTLQQIHRHPTIDLAGFPARLLDIAQPYSARVGFWHPELVVSQGLLDSLDPEHLQAVLVHEQAHADYHDTFWFFWLGWIRRVTFWLPNTETLWQELLMVRELRADRAAAEKVDPLLLAESLLLVVSTPILQPEICAAFSWATSHNRLMERIDALLAEPDEITPTHASFHPWLPLWLPLAFLPLAAIPFHFP